MGRILSPDLYPVAVIQDRYQGCYSHGAWLAIANARQPYDDTMTRTSWCLLNGPHGGDTEAMVFWRDPPEWIAVGPTPEEAVLNLAAARKGKGNA